MTRSCWRPGSPGSGADRPAARASTLAGRASLARHRGLHLVALVASGRGGGDERSAVVEELGTLCTEALTDVEALGLPAEGGPDVIGTLANRGRRLAKDVAKLDGETPEEREQVATLAGHLENHAGLRIGYVVYLQTKSSEAYAASLERANEFLVSAEELAVAMGADECAVRPFADYVPES